MRHRLRAPLMTAGAGIALVAVLITSAAVGTVDLTPYDAGRLTLGHLLPGMPWMSDGTYTPLQDQAVWQFRMPRALLAALAGAALSLAGAHLQAVVRNPLAEPAILGVSSGASVGAVAVVVLGTASTVSISTAAFLAATAATALVFLVAQKNGRIAPARLILCGVALGIFFSAITSYLTLTTEAQNVFSVMFFLLGSVSAATMTSLVAPAAALAIGLVVTAVVVRGMNAMSVGDDAAVALGTDVNRLRVVLLLTAALLTGVVVSVAGGIGFVGLVVPHVARLLVGADHRRMIPLAVTGGALFLATADLLARTVSAPAEVPIGIVTAIVGAPFFLWLMRGHAADEQGIGR
ncbi:FecCD family ABC transporter permease [Myceligenerans xiligouense]|uniref:Iron complex transport system permease protein n=1 Tax=Myceligenerans xiligouense TaxID=253184 RepID=A0A3N4Z5U8_9MICO|nr:iron ABC transporter permease [Myceligenerans xiligouense]RPF20622.1 iron complex transport system permease protein [Myceligenerans xiligouense]